MPTTAMMIDALVAMRNEPGGVPPDHFWQLVERFRADMVNQAFATLGNQEDAEDVAQTTLAKSFRELHTLKDPHKLGNWMRSINRRNALNFMRSRSRRSSYVQKRDHLDESIAAPLTTPTGRDLATVRRTNANKQVALAVDALPDQQREVVVLRYWERKTNDEIAYHLGIPVGTVKSRLARADQFLSEKLKRIWNEE